MVGHTIDDRRLLATGRVFVTGAFAAEEAVPLIKAQKATIALLPSICPETWCFSLAEAWRPVWRWPRSISARRPNASGAPAAASCYRSDCRRVQSIMR